MAHEHKVGDHVVWNSEEGHIHGTIVKVHTKDMTFAGKHRPASPEEPQYEVKSDKTGAHAVHKGSALKSAS